MTPPIRPSWTDLDYLTLCDALDAAERQAIGMGEPHVVCARIQDGVLGFDVMTVRSWTGLQATGNAKYIARIADIGPGGTRSIDVALSPTPL